MVHDARVALDGPLNCQVAAVARVGDLIVLEDLDGNLDSVDGAGSVLEEGHRRFRSTVASPNIRLNSCQSLLVDHSLLACLEVKILILHAVIAFFFFDYDCTEIYTAWPLDVGSTIQLGLMQRRNVVVGVFRGTGRIEEAAGIGRVGALLVLKIEIDVPLCIDIGMRWSGKGNVQARGQTSSWGPIHLR